MQGTVRHERALHRVQRIRDTGAGLADPRPEPAADPDADLSRVASVASFFISRVDVEVDKRLEANGSDDALALRGKAAVAQGKLAYKLFQEKFAGERWSALAARGARVQRPLWASTGAKNPDYSDTLYVDELIGASFKIHNPNATAACGCGTSFSV